MKFFIDTEFIESGPSRPIALISIGIVAEDGREFYAISSEFNPHNASQWVKDNVLANLQVPAGEFCQPVRVIADRVLEFVWPNEAREKPEFWGYYADYDWVVFCQMFGTMMDLPKGFPMYCRDIKQVCDDRGNPPLPVQGKGEHNAIADARWNREAYNFLMGITASR